MVHVKVLRDSQQRLSSIFAEGHAGWAERGEDVVCAAVSAILQAAWLGLERVANVAVEGKKHDGMLTVRWPEAARSQVSVEAIVKTAELAIEQIAQQYPKSVRLSRETERQAP